MTDRVPSVAEIQAAVCEWFNVRPLDMKSHRRSRCVARPRQVAMYLAAELTPLTLAQIGRHFGGRDHTTVVHAVRIVPAIADHEPAVAEAVGALRLRLSGDPNQFALKLAL